METGAMDVVSALEEEDKEEQEDKEEMERVQQTFLAFVHLFAYQDHSLFKHPPLLQHIQANTLMSTYVYVKLSGNPTSTPIIDIWLSCSIIPFFNTNKKYMLCSHPSRGCSNYYHINSPAIVLF